MRGPPVAANMPAELPLLSRLLRLSAFSGIPAAALRSLYTYFGEQLPACTLAVLLVRGVAPGQCRLVGVIGADGNEYLAVDDAQDTQQKLPLFDDALSARLLGNIAPRLIALNPDEQTLPLAQALFAPRVLLALPIIDSGHVRHWLVLGSTDVDRFDRLDLDRMLIEANLAVSYIVRPLALRELSDEAAHSRHQIEGLADVQKLLLPQNIQIRGLDYAVHWQPADTAAGDYYDLVMLNERVEGVTNDTDGDVWTAIIADVSGHGAASAMEAVQFDAILRTYQGDGGAGPAGAITYANRYFFSRRQRQHFLTTLGTLYRPDERKLYYVSAGHPPLLHRRGNTVTLHGQGEAIPLGILRDHVWQNSELALQRDDVVVLYTDGIVEARNADGEPFGMARLRELVAQSEATDAARLQQILCDALFAHQGASVGVDDQTLIVLRIIH